MQAVAEQCFPRCLSAKPPQQPYQPQHPLDLIARKRYCRRFYRQAKELSPALAHAFDCLLPALVSLAKAIHAKLTDQLATDRQDWCMRLADDVRDAIADSRQAKLAPQVRRLKRLATFGFKSLPMLKDATGEVVGTQLAARRRWQEHFSGLDVGQFIGTEQLLSQAVDR